MYQKILVPIDGSTTATAGLDEAIKLARVCGARLRLLHLVDELSLVMGTGYGVAYPDDLIDLLKEGGSAILRAGEDKARAAGLTVDSVLGDNLQGGVRQQVVQQALDWGADLIVLGTHGRRGPRRLFLGSDAEDILRHAPVPVLLVRAPTSAAPASGAN